MRNLAEHIPAIRAELLRWYRCNGRDLPWRDETDPYRIWVSEVMLQQTQVVTVVPYYRRFLARFPTVESLAAASQGEVLKLWEGLGYYARARNLHRAARDVVEKWAGRLPQTSVQLRTLPGFGEYTAAAVASIAFGEAVAVVDGNVRRVLARLFAVETDVTRNPGARRIRQAAQQLLEPHHPGDWNQAVMELGATVCTPKLPHCAGCPLREWCRARQLGLQAELPRRPPRRRNPHFQVTAAVIRNGDKILIAQRPEDSMLGGLWEFPGGKQEAGESLLECLRREIEEELGVQIQVGRLLISLDHAYTHFKITLHAFECRLVSGAPQAIGVANWRWVTLAEMDEYPFPRTDQQIIGVITNEHSSMNRIPTPQTSLTQ